MTVSQASNHVYRQLAGRRSANPLPAGSESSSLRLVELESVHRRRAHRHPLSEEIIYVEAGEGLVWIDGTFERIVTGDVIRVPSGALHGTIPRAGSQMRLICFFPHADLDQNLEETDIEIPEQEEPN